MTKIKIMAVLVSICLFSGATHAQQSKFKKEANDGVEVSSSNVCYTFPGAPTITISTEGNIIVFRGSNQNDHMFNEGYVLCDSASPTRYSNSVIGESGFNAAACNCNGNTCNIVRTTSDGRMRITQEMTKPAGLDRTLNIKMTVRNLTGSNINNVILRRIANVDINSIFEEWHEATRDSSSAWGTKIDNTPYAVRLRHITRSPVSTIYEAKTTNLFELSCNPNDQTVAGPVFGDYDSTVQYGLGVLGPFASKSVTVQYLRD